MWRNIKEEKDKKGRVTVREGCTGTSREVCVCLRSIELHVFLRKTRNIICVQRSGVHGESWGRFQWPRMGG